MNTKKYHLKNVVIITALILMVTSGIANGSDNKVKDMILEKFQETVAARLDDGGYGRIAKIVGNMDPTKWEQYAKQINKKYLMKEFNWYGWEFFNFLYSLYIVFSNKQDFSVDVPRFYFDNFTSATVLLLLSLSERCT